MTSDELLGFINKVIKERKSEADLKEAKDHEIRVRMHTEAILTGQKVAVNQAFIEFFKTVQALITPEKFERFKQCMRLPIVTNKICTSMFTELSRALSATNKVIDHNFTGQTAEQNQKDFNDYLESIGIEDFLQNKAIDTLKKRFNSFVVCDLPSASEDLQDEKGLPRPYFKIIEVDDVFEVYAEEDGTCDYILYNQDLKGDEGNLYDCKLAYLDKHWQAVVVRLKGQTEFIFLPEFTPQLHLVEVENKPFCPAFKFWSPLVSCENEVNSESPITESLADLDEYLFKSTGIRYAETYAMYPIYWGYKQKCDYHETIGEEEIKCTDGLLTTYTSSSTGELIPVHKTCPKCSAKQYMGAGTFIEIDTPQMQGDFDGRDPLGIIPPDVNSLKMMDEKLTALEKKIRYDVTGNTMEAINSQAMNEDQVNSSFEVRQNILINIKKNFEITLWRIYNVLGSMRYEGNYVGSTVDLGNQFFLQSQEKVNKDYDDARKAGRPSFELSMKRNTMYSTAYQSNPLELQRVKIYENIEPYQSYTIQELKNLGVDLTDPTGFAIKLNFDNFVNRYEREYGSLVTIGQGMDFNTKIKTINAKLTEYANEQSKNTSITNPDGAQNATTSSDGRSTSNVS